MVVAEPVVRSSEPPCWHSTVFGRTQKSYKSCSRHKTVEKACRSFKAFVLRCRPFSRCMCDANTYFKLITSCIIFCKYSTIPRHNNNTKSARTSLIGTSETLISYNPAFSFGAWTRPFGYQVYPNWKMEKGQVQAPGKAGLFDMRVLEVPSKTLWADFVLMWNGQM